MSSIIGPHREFWTQAHRRSLYVGLILLALACAVQIGASHYSARSATNFVGDIFLDNIPAVDVDFIIVDGAFVFLIIAIALAIIKPKYLLFGLKATALFIIVRGFFITLTHIGIYPHQLHVAHDLPGQAIYNLTNDQANFFFSGHTGMPLLFAFIMWPEKPWRYLFMATSCVMAVSVLLARVHYSIDVFAAPFMTYCIFQIAIKLFPEDFALIDTPSTRQEIKN
jgi:hypothetical protein